MMREGDWGLFMKLFPIFWVVGMVAYLYGWVDYYLLSEQSVGWNSWLLLPLMNAIGQIGLSAAALAAVCVVGKSLLARAPASATAEEEEESASAGSASESSCASPRHDVSSGRATARISNSGEVPMYFRRPLHNLSGVLRPLPTQRYIMMTMGGYWPVIDKLHNGHLGVVTRDSDFHVGEGAGSYSSTRPTAASPGATPSSFRRRGRTTATRPSASQPRGPCSPPSSSRSTTPRASTTS